MVSFTSLAAVVSMALFATTTNAAPAAVAERQPPPTSSVLQFTLYKTLQPGEENQCWWAAQGNNFGSVPPSELVPRNGASWSACHQADFYTLQIFNEAQGYNCQVNVYSDNACANYVGAVQYTGDFSKPCAFPGGSLVDLLSWEVSCV